MVVPEYQQITQSYEVLLIFGSEELTNNKNINNADTCAIPCLYAVYSITGYTTGCAN